MDSRPEQRREGALIGLAQKRSGLSQRQAAIQAGMSENHWRAIVKGYRTVSAGVYAPVRAPAETIARMARVVGVTPQQLEKAGRADAAEELRNLPAEDEPEREPTMAEVLAQLAALRARVAELEGRTNGTNG